MTKILRVGWNHTRWGHYMRPNYLRVVKQFEGKDIIEQYDSYGTIEKRTGLRQFIEHQILNGGVCRVWIFFDNTSKCVYWYQQGILDEF